MSRLTQAVSRGAALLIVAAALSGEPARAAETPVVRDTMPSAVPLLPPAPAPASASASASSAGQAPAHAAADCPPDPQAPTRDEALAAMRNATDSGFLWKATKGGHSSWLYGTIHVAQRSWMVPGPHVLKALQASDVIALELDPTDPDINARLQRAIVRRPGAPELSPALEARLRAQMAAECLAPSLLEGLRPEMRAVTVEVMGGRRIGLFPAFGIDVVIAGMGRGMKKPIRSLETPESQASLLVSDDPRETEHSVSDILDELESGNAPRILGRLASDWHRGDLDDLGTYADWCGCLSTPEQRADFVKLVDDRNPLMASRIAQWHAEGTSLFVAVGTLHMLGDNGLPALLRARGFVVDRVTYGTAR
jgi:uncharacterized protein YbaP (TraB family)